MYPCSGKDFPKSEQSETDVDPFVMACAHAALDTAALDALGFGAKKDLLNPDIS